MSTMAIGGPKPAANKTVRESIKFHLILGFVIVLVLVVGLGGWASTVLISGALIAPGQIVVESNVKKVQHPTGGVVGEVRARDGDLVKAGDIVVRLDDTVTKANLAPSSPRISTPRRRVRRACRPSSAGSTGSNFRRP
ncbi:multidrug efflux pump subunit AcrA (membrane-fusion protein) [Bradyrhizobium ottawaense]